MAPQHLDISTIKFRTDNGEERSVDDASLELYRKLGGNKFCSGKIFKYGVTEADGLYLQKLWVFGQDKKKREALEAKCKRFWVKAGASVRSDVKTTKAEAIKAAKVVLKDLRKAAKMHLAAKHKLLGAAKRAVGTAITAEKKVCLHLASLSYLPFLSFLKAAY